MFSSSSKKEIKVTTSHQFKLTKSSFNHIETSNGNIRLKKKKPKLNIYIYKVKKKHTQTVWLTQLIFVDLNYMQMQ